MVGAIRNRFVLYICVCAIILGFWTGCSTAKPAKPEPIDYVKPATIEAAQYAINERIASLERALGESRSLNDDARSEIGDIRKSCEAIVNAGRRSDDLIQDTLEQAEALYRWVAWANSRLQCLESLLEIQVQN